MVVFVGSQVPEGKIDSHGSEEPWASPGKRK
jgi:hypothetical protein